jgi:hypothetical protein
VNAFISNSHSLVFQCMWELDIRDLHSVILLQLTTQTEIILSCCSWQDYVRKCKDNVISSSPTNFKCDKLLNKIHCSATPKASVCKLNPLQNCPSDTNTAQG